MLIGDWSVDVVSSDLPDEVVQAAAARFRSIDDSRQQQLASNVVYGLPGSVGHLTLADVRTHLAEYRQIDADQLRRHFYDFLQEIAPVDRKSTRLNSSH